MMKFRSSIHVFRTDSKDLESRPGTAMTFKFPGVREKQSTTTLTNGENNEQQGPQSPKASRKKVMQDFLHKTGAGLKATGASIKASGAKLERRIPRKRSKVERSSSVRFARADVAAGQTAFQT
jgi:hypothetical protein